MASHSVYLGVTARSTIIKMLSRILLVLIVVTCVLHTESAPVSRARQFIPAQPGFIPVYIRPGDTPLEDINLELAEAFASYAKKHGRLTYGRSINDVLAEQKSKEKRPLSNLDDLTLEENNNVNATSGTEKIVVEVLPQHIQKIPKS